MKKISIIQEKGDSKAFFVVSLINGIIYTVWFFIYIVCLILRSYAFNTAQNTMALGGYSAYTIEVSSPVFGVLKFFVFLLPVIMLIWTVMLKVCDSKNKTLCDKWIIIATIVADALCAFAVTLDITTLHMIFG